MIFISSEVFQLFFLCPFSIFTTTLLFMRDSRQWTLFYYWNLRLNICICTSSSRSSSISSGACNLSRLSNLNHCWSLSLTEMILFYFDSSSTTVDEIKSNSQEKYVELSLNFNSLFISQNFSTQCLPYSSWQVISACRPPSSVLHEKVLVRFSASTML